MTPSCWSSADSWRRQKPPGGNLRSPVYTLTTRGGLWGPGWSPGNPRWDRQVPWPPGNPSWPLSSTPWSLWWSWRRSSSVPSAKESFSIPNRIPVDTSTASTVSRDFCKPLPIYQNAQVSKISLILLQQQNVPKGRFFSSFYPHWTLSSTCLLNLTANCHLGVWKTDLLCLTFFRESSLLSGPVCPVEKAAITPSEVSASAQIPAPGRHSDGSQSRIRYRDIRKQSLLTANPFCFIFGFVSSAGFPG